MLLISRCKDSVIFHNIQTYPEKRTNKVLQRRCNPRKVTISFCKMSLFVEKLEKYDNFTFYNRSFVKCNDYICSDKTKQPKATTK